MEAKVPEDVEENVLQPPDWLPDGWVMEVKHGEDGTPYQYFVSPTSGSKFRMKAEVLNYLFAEMDEHWIQSKEKAACSSMLLVCFPYYGVKSLLILFLRIAMTGVWIALS
ncbi:hypothetical protein ACQ4PT_002816 [Festuca glaucescens]